MNAVKLGSACELLAASWFSAHGYDIQWPEEQRSKHDFLIRRGRKWEKVQVKSLEPASKGRGARIQARCLHRSVKYRPGEVDYFVGVDLTQRRLWIAPYIEGRATYSVSKLKELTWENTSDPDFLASVVDQAMQGPTTQMDGLIVSLVERTTELTEVLRGA